MFLHIARCLTVGLQVALFSAATLAQNAIPMTDFRSGPGNGLYSFASSTPATVQDLIQTSRPRPAATGQGQLVLPSGAPADARMPAVVLVHGSGGVYREELTYWAKLLSEQGIAAFVIDVFSPRGVKSTGEDQSQVPATSLIWTAAGGSTCLPIPRPRKGARWSTTSST